MVIKGFVFLPPAFCFRNFFAGEGGFGKGGVGFRGDNG